MYIIIEYLTNMIDHGQTVAEWLRRSLRTRRAWSLGSNLTTAIGPSTGHTRLTQPATFSGMANQVPASVKAATSPLSGGR